MLAFSALCILLPVVASALETCGPNQTAAFLAGPQLDGGLNYFVEKDSWWFDAVSANGAGTYQSIQVNFYNVSSDSASAHFEYRDYYGNITLTEDRTYTWQSDHVSTDANLVYFIKCSDNLVAGYRCLEEGTTGGSGPKYFFWALLSKTAAEVSTELQQCLAKIQEVETEPLVFVPRFRP